MSLLDYKDVIQGMSNADLLAAYHGKGQSKEIRELVVQEIDCRIANQAVETFMMLHYRHKMWQLECLIIPPGARSVPRGHIDPLTGQRQLWILTPPLPSYLKTKQVEMSAVTGRL